MARKSVKKETTAKKKPPKKSPAKKKTSPNKNTTTKQIFNHKCEVYYAPALLKFYTDEKDRNEILNKINSNKNVSERRLYYSVLFI